MRQIQNEIAEIILQAQEESGLTQKEFADQAGVSTKSLAYWKTGQRIPRDIELIDGILQKIGKTVILGKQEA